METAVSFDSEGLKSSGFLHVPDDLKDGAKRPAVMVIHGFGGSKFSLGMTMAAETLCDWGYVALRFDMRGCGESEGTPGRIISFEQVSDAKSAITYLISRPEVDPEKIIILGDSMGGAVSVYTCAVDSRLAGVVSLGGWGNGAQKLEGQHPGPGQWDKFLQMLEDGRRYREETGESLMVSRFDIVPIPERLRHRLPEDAVMEFPAETAQSIYDFRPNDIISYIAPRPILLLHAAKDSVTPTESSIEMFHNAQLPVELILLTGIDHFPLASGNERLYETLKGWFDIYFPV